MPKQLQVLQGSARKSKLHKQCYFMALCMFSRHTRIMTTSHAGCYWSMMAAYKGDLLRNGVAVKQAVLVLSKILTSHHLFIQEHVPPAQEMPRTSALAAAPDMH